MANAQSDFDRILRTEGRLSRLEATQYITVAVMIAVAIKVYFP